MDFITDRLEGGRYIHTLTVFDQFTRECPVLEAALSLTGKRVAECLDSVAVRGGYPQFIIVNKGVEFSNRAMDARAYAYGGRLDFI